MPDNYFPPLNPGTDSRNFLTRQELSAILGSWLPPASRSVLSAGTDELATTTVNTTETIAHTKVLTDLPPNQLVTIDLMVGLQVATPTPGQQIEIRPAIDGTPVGIVAVQDTSRVSSSNVSISGTTAVSGAHSHDFSVVTNTNSQASSVTETTTYDSGTGHTHGVPFGHNHGHLHSDTGNTSLEGGGLGHFHTWSGEGAHTHNTTASSKLRLTKRWVTQLTVDETGQVTLGAAVRYSGGTKTNQETDIQWIVWR